MSHQTRCPTCQTIYPMPPAKLGDLNARAKCGQCQQVFSLNDNLVSTAVPAQAQAQVRQTQPVAQPSQSQGLQTQCPHCKLNYPMPPAKLGDPNARAKCGQCQQVFSLNDNLVSPNGTPAVHKHQQAQASPSDDLSLPVVPRRPKRTRAVPTEGMIHDGMEGGNSHSPTGGAIFSNDELDNFLNDDISITPHMTKSTKDEMADNEGEAWLNDLLADKPVKTANQVNHAPASPIVNDVDLNAIIPTATPRPKKPVSAKKIEAETPTAQQLAEEKSIIGQLLWVAGCLILVALLGVQYALFNTDKLAKNPESAGLVQTLCGVLPCKVPSADLSSLHIDSSVQNGRDVVIIINNTSATAQLFPYLLVQLKDSNGAVVADFVADTKDYLSGSQTTLLAGQHKRVQLSVTNPVNAGSVVVTPFYR